EVGEGVCCPACTDTMACIAINYSWHLILPRGTQGVRDNARERLRGKEIPGIPLPLQPLVGGGQQVTLQLITKLEKAAGQRERQPDHRQIDIDGSAMLVLIHQTPLSSWR
ncbi:hypothetical protein KUCAC02_028747, partial [Chaenocephalus aceratus]